MLRLNKKVLVSFSNNWPFGRKLDISVSFQGPNSIDTIVAPSATKTAIAAPVHRTAAETQSAYAQQLAEVSDFADYGAVLSSSNKPAALTESETEYVVTCVKHIFKEHVVFQVGL